MRSLKNPPPSGVGSINRLEYVKAAFYLSLLGPVLYFTLILRDIHQGHRLAIQVTLPQIAPLVTHADSVLDVVQSASQKQSDYYDPSVPGGFTQRMFRLVNHADHLIGTTDLSLNGGPFHGRGVIAQIGDTLEGATKLETRATSNMDDTFTRLQPTLDNLATGSKVFVTDLPPIMADIKESTANTAAATKSGASAMAHMDASAGDVQAIADKVRSDWFKAKNRAWYYFKTAIGLGANAGSIANLK